MCPRSSYPFYIESYYIKWVTPLGHPVVPVGQAHVELRAGLPGVTHAPSPAEFQALTIISMQFLLCNKQHTRRFIY